MKLHVGQVNHVENGAGFVGHDNGMSFRRRFMNDGHLAWIRPEGDDAPSFTRCQTDGISRALRKVTNATTFRLDGSLRSAPPDRRWHRQRRKRPLRRASTLGPMSPGQNAAATERRPLAADPSIPTTRRQHRRSEEAPLRAPIAQAASPQATDRRCSHPGRDEILSISSDERSTNRLSMGSIVRCNGCANAFGRRQIG